MKFLSAIILGNVSEQYSLFMPCNRVRPFESAKKSLKMSIQRKAVEQLGLLCSDCFKLFPQFDFIFLVLNTGHY